MKINTESFEFSHGKAPKGRGLWALYATGTDGDGAYTSETYYINGKLSDAIREAAKNLKRDCSRVKAIVDVEVLP